MLLAALDCEFVRFECRGATLVLPLPRGLLAAQPLQQLAARAARGARERLPLGLDLLARLTQLGPVSAAEPSRVGGKLLDGGCRSGGAIVGR